MAGLMAVLLRDHRIELVPEGDDEWDITRSKALKKIDDRQTGIAMKMKTNVRLRFVRRT